MKSIMPPIETSTFLQWCSRIMYVAIGMVAGAVIAVPMAIAIAGIVSVLLLCGLHSVLNDMWYDYPPKNTSE